MPKSWIAENWSWCKNWSHPFQEMCADTFPLSMHLRLTSVFLYRWCSILYCCWMKGRFSNLYMSFSEGFNYAPTLAFLQVKRLHWREVTSHIYVLTDHQGSGLSNSKCKGSVSQNIWSLLAVSEPWIFTVLSQRRAFCYFVNCFLKMGCPTKMPSPPNVDYICIT